MKYTHHDRHYSPNPKVEVRNEGQGVYISARGSRQCFFILSPDYDPLISCNQPSVYISSTWHRAVWALSTNERARHSRFYFRLAHYTYCSLLTHCFPHVRARRSPISSDTLRHAGKKGQDLPPPFQYIPRLWKEEIASVSMHPGITL